MNQCNCDAFLSETDPCSLKALRLPNDLLFCAIFRIWKENLPLKCAICDVFFNRCLSIAFTLKRSSFTFLNMIFFLLNCSKFAVECDYNSKNSQNVQNWCFFGEIDGFFKIATCGKFFLECVSNGIFS